VPYALEIKIDRECIPPSSETFIIMCFLLFFKGPSFFMEKHFIALGTLGRAHRRIIYGFKIFPTTTPLGL
jgi:hypothetical protein